MKKRFLIALLLLILIFLGFAFIRESSKKINNNYNVIKNYNFVK